MATASRKARATKRNHADLSKHEHLQKPWRPNCSVAGAEGAARIFGAETGVAEERS